MSKIKQGSLKITTVVKQKNTGRIEAGKRLAAISKHAKETKLREKIEKENPLNDNVTMIYTYIFGLTGIIVCLVGLYYTRK